MKPILMLLVAAVALLIGVGSVAAQEEQLAGVELQAMADTFQYALENNPTSEPSDWVNPDRDRSGAVVPTRTFENSQRQPCREFVTTIIIGDQEEQGYGTACRQVDGNWQIVEEAEPRVTPPPTQVQNYFVTPPPVYYAYPSGFYGPSSIYLSFGYVFRSGNLHRGHHYLDGRSFRSRYPYRVRNRVNLGTQIFYRYRLHDELKYRDWERRSRKDYKRYDKRNKKSGKGWREKRRDEKHDRDRRHD